MFIEKLFGNTFGMVWLIIFLVAVLALMLWVILKKDKEVKVVEEVKEEKSVEEVSVVEEKKEEVPVNNGSDGEYEIVESEDGFFRVRKIGSERTLRKFSTRVEAENFIEKRGLKHD